MNDIRTKIAALEEQVRKLKVLDQLLSDPEVAAAAKEQLIKQAAATASSRDKSDARPRRRNGRKRGLKKKALEIVSKSTVMLTAKQVAELIEKEGFNIKAENKTVA